MEGREERAGAHFRMEAFPPKRWVYSCSTTTLHGAILPRIPRSCAKTLHACPADDDDEMSGPEAPLRPQNGSATPAQGPASPWRRSDSARSPRSAGQALWRRLKQAWQAVHAIQAPQRGELAADDTV
jgi:hypothetical protein